MPTGLTDRQQAELTFVSGILIAVGAVSVPAGLPWYFGLGIAVCGAIGFGLKEVLGAKPTEPKPKA